MFQDVHVEISYVRYQCDIRRKYESQRQGGDI